MLTGSEKNIYLTLKFDNLALITMQCKVSKIKYDESKNFGYLTQLEFEDKSSSTSELYLCGPIGVSLMNAAPFTLILTSCSDIKPPLHHQILL